MAGEEITQNPDGQVVQLKTVAKQRGWQTFLQGLLVDVAVGVAIVVLASVNTITTTEGLVAMGISILKSIVTATAAYVIRLYKDKSGFADTLPPQEPPLGPGAQRAA